MNDYLIPGVYYVIDSSDVKTIQNAPVKIEFKLIVEYQFGNVPNYIMQTFIDYTTLIKYCRRSFDSGKSWRTWYKMNTPTVIS